MNYKVLLFCIFIILITLFGHSLADTTDQQDSIKIEKAKTEWIDKWWGKDKAEHFLISAFLAGASYKIYHDQWHNKKKGSLYFSTGFTLSLGLGKEIYDETRPQKKFSYKDLIYDILGIGVGLLIITR
jgi:putative lipoprotein